MSREPSEPGSNWWTPLLLLVATFVSTSYVGARAVGVDPFTDGSLAAGFPYSIPLMAILATHELGHYVAARIHRVPVSPPYFLPVPIGPLGTMGAVILMPQRIRSPNALLDIGAAGPLAGLAVALPVLVYGIVASPVLPLPERGFYYAEGHSLLYVALLRLFKGPIPEGHDIMLSPTAFAGWAGLLVTMINLIPALQLDGGHVARALVGERFEALSRLVRHSLLPIALVVGVAYGELEPAVPWLVWWVMLGVFARLGGREHPPTDPGPLSRRRRWLGWFTLALFVLLFMPSWLRGVTVG